MDCVHIQKTQGRIEKPKSRKTTKTNEMKKIVFCIGMVIFGLSNFTVSAQGSWFLQNNPTTNSGESIQFVSANEGWIGLDSNQLLHTINGGINWNVVTPNSTDVTDGINAPGSRLSFINTTTGWAIKTLGNNSAPLGAVLYKTTDGGTTWNKTVLSTTTGDAAIQVQFIDTNTGWVLIFNMNNGTPTFLKTINGGTTWTTTNGGGVFYYVNATTGYSYSAGPNLAPPYTIYKTTDGGTSWTPQYTDSSAGQLNAMQFTDANNGWVVGESGKIYKTTNGGTSWSTVTTAGTNSNFKNFTVNFITSNIGWISTRDNSNNTNPNMMLHTTDAGATWTQQNLPLGNKIYCAAFWDANHGWAASDIGSSSTGQIARYFYDPLGTYTLYTLRGPWFGYLNPLDPYNSQFGYMVFDGMGTIIDGNQFPGPANGNYSVNPDGTFSGTLFFGSQSTTFGGVLTSQTEATGSNSGLTFNFHKIVNPSALKDRISGTLTTNCSQRTVTLDLDSNGQIIASTGLTAPVTGRVYSDLGVFLGHIKTGESADGWNEFSIMGYYTSSSNLLTGHVAVTMSSCNSTTSASLVRSDILATTDFGDMTKNVIIYPNPNNGSFNVYINEPKSTIQIDIYDDLGQKVYETSNENQQSTNAIHFNPGYSGIYFIKVFDGENVYKDKILIQ